MQHTPIRLANCLGQARVKFVRIPFGCSVVRWEPPWARSSSWTSMSIDLNRRCLVWFRFKSFGHNHGRLRLDAHVVVHGKLVAIDDGWPTVAMLDHEGLATFLNRLTKGTTRWNSLIQTTETRESIKANYNEQVHLHWTEQGTQK